MAEQRPFKPLVVGSTPTAPTISQFIRSKLLIFTGDINSKLCICTQEVQIERDLCGSHFSAYGSIDCACLFALAFGRVSDSLKGFANVIFRNDAITLLNVRCLVAGDHHADYLRYSATIEIPNRGAPQIAKRHPRNPAFAGRSPKSFGNLR